MSGCQIDEGPHIVDVRIGLTMPEENLLGNAIAPQADGPNIETRGIFLDQPAWQGGHAAAMGHHQQHDVGCFDRLVLPGADPSRHQKLGIDVQPVGLDRIGNQNLPGKLMGCHECGIAEWKACAERHDRTVRNVASKRIQADEIWSFCYAKQKNVATAKAAPEDAGDVWTWTALDADSKLIVSYLIGGRDAGYAHEFMEDVASRLANRVQLTTDGLKAYLEAVDGAFDSDIDYAQPIKLYGDVPGPAGRYSPTECTGIKKNTVEDRTPPIAHGCRRSGGSIFVPRPSGMLQSTPEVMGRSCQVYRSGGTGARKRSFGYWRMALRRVRRHRCMPDARDYQWSVLHVA